MKTVHIYRKTHKKTGKMYIGRTQQDPYRYEGSGRAWREHLKEHGYDMDTEILFSSDKQAEVKQFCIDFAVGNEYWKEDAYFNECREDGGRDITGKNNPNYKHGRAVNWKSDPEVQRKNDKIRNAKYYQENKEKEAARMRQYYKDVRDGKRVKGAKPTSVIRPLNEDI